MRGGHERLDFSTLQVLFQVVNPPNSSRNPEIAISSNSSRCIWRCNSSSSNVETSSRGESIRAEEEAFRRLLSCRSIFEIFGKDYYVTIRKDFHFVNFFFCKSSIFKLLQEKSRFEWKDRYKLLQAPMMSSFQGGPPSMPGRSLTNPIQPHYVTVNHNKLIAENRKRMWKFSLSCSRCSYLTIWWGRLRPTGLRSTWSLSSTPPSNHSTWEAEW